MFFVVGLVVLGGTYATTESEALQVVAVFALIFGVHPALSRLFAGPDEHLQAVQNRNMPFSVLTLSLAFAVAWGAVVILATSELGLGPWFGFWAVIWPWAEVLAYLGERSLRRDGAEAWQPARPLRDSALAGLATAPCIIAIMLLPDSSARAEAIATGLACGLAVFACAGTITWLMRRGRHADRVVAESDPPGGSI